MPAADEQKPLDGDEMNPEDEEEIAKTKVDLFDGSLAMQRNSKIEYFQETFCLKGGKNLRADGIEFNLLN